MALQICPLMSIGNDVNNICLQESCAWYMKNYKTCAIYMIAHNASLNVREKIALNKDGEQKT